jgi:hypothetical protein
VEAKKTLYIDLDNTLVGFPSPPLHSDRHTEEVSNSV